MAAAQRDPYEIGRSLGIKDPATLEQWVQTYGPRPSEPTPASAPSYDPDSPEAWQDAAAKAGAPGGVRAPSGPTYASASNSSARSAPGKEDNVPLFGNTSNGSNAASRPTAEDAKFGNDDDAQRRASARFYEEKAGMSPEAARRAAGVETQPGEVGAPKDPRVGATFYNPEDDTTTVGRPGSLTMVSKGGRTPQSWTTQTSEGLHFSPETEQAANDWRKSSLGAAESARDAGAKEADREMGYLQRHEQLQQQRYLDQRARAINFARQMDAENDKLATMTDAVREDKIDPSSFFTGHGAAGAFAASIAYTLGAVGGALTHTENPVIGVIRSEIDGQKQNAALNRQKLEDQKSLMGQLTKSYGDSRVAEEAAWMAYLEKAKTTMGRIAADSKSDWVRAKYNSAVADLDKEWAGHKQKWDELTQDRVVRAQHDVNAPPVYAGGPAKLDKTTREEVSKISEALEKAGIPAALAQLKDVDRTIDTFGEGDIPGVGVVKNHVPSWMLTDEGVANRQAMQALKNNIGHSIFGGALSPTEADKLNAQLEGANDAASLRRVVQSYRQALHEKEKNIRSMGADEANVEFDRRQKENARRSLPLTKPATPHVKRPE